MSGTFHWSEPTSIGLGRTRVRVGDPANVGRAAQMHSRLQRRERRTTAGQRDDLAVDERVLRLPRQGHDLGIGGRHVIAGPARDPHAPGADVDEHPDSVPLELVRPARIRGQPLRSSGEHGQHSDIVVG